MGMIAKRKERRLSRGKGGRSRGMIAAELALVLPVLMSVLLLVVEGSSVLSAYLTLNEIGREAARQVLRTDGDVDVPALIAGLATGLPGEAPAARVLVDEAARTVTVQLEYAYVSFFGENGPLALLGNEHPVLGTAAVMPLP